MEEGCVTKVRQDFFTTNEGEITLLKGDFFQIYKVIDKYWCYGCSKKKFGQFPSNNLLETEVPPLSQNEELFVALEDFQGQEAGDLSFRKGDFIVGEEKLDEHWWRGYVQKGRSGMFPDNYTWQLDSAPLKKSKTQHVRLQAHVKMSLTAQLDEEMDLRAGEIVTITEKIDKDWYRGVCGNRSGIFPASYVTLLSDDPPSFDDIYPDSTSLPSTNVYQNTNSVFDTNSNSTTDLLTFSPEREIEPSIPAAESFDSFSSVSSMSATSSTSALKDLLTFSPDRETAPVQDLSDQDIFQDDYFRVNMPSAYTGGTCLPNYDTSAVGKCVDVEENTSSVPPYGVTLYPFYAQFNNELSFHENEFVHIIRYVDNDWMEGELDGRRGIFPVNYINVLVDCARPDTDYLTSATEPLGSEDDLPVLAPHTLAKVKYNFDAQMSCDLCVKEGEIVMIVNSVDKDWYTVKNRLGSAGLCPANHLEKHSGPDDSTLLRSSSFSAGDDFGSLVESPIDEELIPVATPVPRASDSSKTSEGERIKNEGRTPPERPPPARPPPAKRKVVLSDKGPHRPAPPAPLPGKSPVHRSIRRLPRQTSAPSDFVKTDPAVPMESSEEKRKKLSEQRQNVISELVLTEKDYLRDLKMTYEVFNLYNPKHLEAKGVDVKGLFGNVLEVIQVSEELLDSLQWSMKNKEESEQMVGPCFLEHADRIKSVYSEYCTNHENALLLLTKYKDTPAIQNMFDKGLETFRYQVSCFNMDALLIKPVQRIMKYPLILNELIKSTEDDHPDKAELLKAVKAFTDAASDINEFKRRKDIVSKYLVNGNDTLARKMTRLSLHSVAKKSSRIGARITSSLGLSSSHKDEIFVELEKRFQSLEKTIRLLVRNIEVVMSQLYSEVKILFDIGEELVPYYGDQSSRAPEVEGFRRAQKNIADSIWQGFRKTVNKRVIEPLTTLADLFEGPRLLVEKRNDKLLDYDNVLARSEKSQDRKLAVELQIARNNYEALNQQLVEELPPFIDMSMDLLVQFLAAFIGARKLLSGNVTKRYMTLLEETGVSSVTENLVDTFEVKHLLVCKQLARSTFAGKPLRSEGEETSKLAPRETSKTPSPVAQKVGNITDGLRPSQPESQSAFLRSKYSPENLFRLKENHGSVEVYDLSLSIGHLVAVIKKQDPMGNTSRWFVDDGKVSGFVRSSCLEPAGSPVSSQVPQSNFQSSSARSSVRGNTLSFGDRRYHSRSESPELRSSTHSFRENRIDALRSSSLASAEVMSRLSQVSNSSAASSSFDSERGSTGNQYDLPPEYDEVAGNSTSPERAVHYRPPAPVVPNKPPDLAFYHAVYDFEAATPHALSVKRGQVVNVLQRHDNDGNSEWWYVEDRHGSKGFVPANYLSPYQGCINSGSVGKPPASVSTAGGTIGGQSKFRRHASGSTGSALSWIRPYKDVSTF